MGMFDALRRGITNAFSKRVTSSLTAIQVGAIEVYTHIDTEKAIAEGYNGNTAVYSIINKDAQKFAAVCTNVIKKNDENDTKLENDLSKLLDRPNEYQGADAFRATVRTYYKLTGEAFIWLNRGILADGVEGKERLKKPVLEMYVLPSDLVIIVPDPMNVFGILSYKLNINGKPMPIPKEDIIHWKNTSLQFNASTRQHLRGQSPLSSGYKTLQQNNSQTDAAVRAAQNDGAKGVLYNETLDKISPTQKAQMEGVINRKINNNDVKGAVASLQGKWGYLDLGKSSTDLELLEGKNLSMKELCFLFDVPYELFDSKTTFANKEQAQRGWVFNSIIPASKQYDDELNRVLLQAFNLEDTAKIESDFDDLPEMREDLNKKVEALMKCYWLTPNQVLDELGFEQSADPRFDEPFIPSGIVPLSQSGVDMNQMAADLAAQGLND